MARAMLAAMLVLSLAAAPASKLQEEPHGNGMDVVADNGGNVATAEGARQVILETDLDSQDPIIAKEKGKKKKDRQEENTDQHSDSYDPLTPWEKMAIMMAGGLSVCAALVCVICAVTEGCPLNRLCCKVKYEIFT